MVHLAAAESPRTEDAADGIRNVCLLGSVGHGKTSINNCLLGSASGETSTEQDGDIRKMGSTYNAEFSSINFKPEKYETWDEQPYVITDNIVCNIIDTPGHAELLHEVTAAIRLVDGAMVVVDPILGLGMQTRRALTISMVERVKPILFINKMDKLLAYKDQEEIYQLVKKIINDANEIISTFSSGDDHMQDFKFCPVLGNVIFGSALHEWAFTLHDMAQYSSKALKLSIDVLIKKLWGDNFHDKANNTWSTSNSDSNERAFNSLILNPLFQIYESVASFKKEELIQLLSTLNINTNTFSFKDESEESLKEVMTKWLPAADTIFRVMIHHLPSPIVAQKYRAEALYEGNTSDDAYKAIENCDPKSPLMMYITKIVPAIEKGKFHAFGRIFSGKIFTGQTVNIVSSSHMPGMKEKVFECTVQNLNIVHGKDLKPVKEVSAGNICCIFGGNNFLVKTATISTFKNALCLKNLKFNTPLVIRRSVEPKNPSDLPKLNDGLKWLSKTDPLIEVKMEESGEQTVSGDSQLHLDICIKKLEEEYAQIQLKTENSIAAYRETVTCESKQSGQTSSPNMKNCIKMKAFPLPIKMVQDIENGSLDLMGDIGAKTAHLSEKYKFDSIDAMNIWTFGPQPDHTNILVDLTKGVDNIIDIKEACIRGFQWCAQHGVLCEEAMRGVGINICDAQIDTSTDVQRNGQIIPLTRQLVYASFLTGNPQLLEPVYESEIICNSNDIDKLREEIQKARGTIVKEMNCFKDAKVIVKANIPVNDSLLFKPGFFSYQQEEFVSQYMFNHWQAIPGNPLEPAVDNMSYNIVCDIRYKKGLQEAIPSASSYLKPH